VQIGPDQPVESKIVLNQALLHLMYSLEQYERMLFASGSALAATREVVDFAYVQDLASQLLMSDDQDISVNECWHMSPLI
jgi:hypothetical protein